ncbi:MAG TPA: energy transducer TonB [Terriglobia bacterium]|nr:energy transducer TonB [Terriglobia bacterium]
MKTSGIFVCVILSFCAASAADRQYQEIISRQFVRHTVVIRNSYTNSVLKFDTTGKLIGNGTPGFGPTDGRIYVESIDLKPDELVIKGQRTFPVDQTPGDVRLTLIGDGVTIKIALPPDKLPSESVPALLEHVFLSNAELKAKGCSAEEQQELRTMLEKWKSPAPADTGQATQDDASTPPQQYCVSEGERAYKAGDGVQAPKAVDAPDPEYPQDAKRDKVAGTTVLLAIIDREGHPTTLQVFQPAEHGFDEAALRAVQRWKFRPATLNGTPVPVLIRIEVNFHPAP